MLRRRSKVPLLGEIPASRSVSSRPGTLGRGQLRAYSNLANSVLGSASVLLTGPAKSDVAIGLAAATIAEGHRVALLECDLVSPLLAATLGLVEQPGFAEYLLGEAEATQVLQPLVLAGPASARATEPLACIVAGGADPPPSQLLHSERCRQAIERLGRAYDLLVVDGPSLAEDRGAVDGLSTFAGATALCVERTEIPRRPPPAIDGLVILG